MYIKLWQDKKDKNSSEFIHIIKWILFESAKKNQSSQRYIKNLPYTSDSVKSPKKQNKKIWNSW